MTESKYQRYRRRKRTGESLPTCNSCDRNIKGKKALERGFCFNCWRKTPEGKVEAAERQAKAWAKLTPEEQRIRNRRKNDRRRGVPKSREEK